MSDGTQITYGKVREDAKVIKECASKMQRIFEDFNQSMKRVGSEDVFYGDANESLGQRYNSLKTKFDGYVKLVNSFADEILGAAEATERTEKAIAEDAGHLAG